MINIFWSDNAILSFWSGFVLPPSKLNNNILYHQISMGLERSWLEQGLTLPPGFSPEEVEAFWTTYNLRRNRHHVGHVDKDATREGLAAALSAMDLRVIKFHNKKSRNKCTKTLLSRF
jgi:hypothetical protein